MSRSHSLEIFADGLKINGQPMHRDEPILGDFVTVLQVAPPTDRKEPYVTVLQVDKDRLQQNGGGCHQEEPMAIYRLPGERLGMALKFEGGARPAEPVQRVFIQSIHPGSPAARAKGALTGEPLREGDEILLIGDRGVVRTMTRGECVTLLRDAPVCIELVVRRHADRRKGPPPPVPPRKSPPLHTPPLADVSLPPLQPPPPELEGFHGVREKIQRLEAARKSRPLDPPPLPPRIAIGKEFILPTESSQPELPDKMVGSSLSLRLPGWEELLQRRAETPRADLFMDLLAQEEDGERSAMESESDDTGSSVSTVIEKFSRGSTANSSFSELHQSSFDLRQVLSPFEQLERELDGVETPPGVQLGVIAPPEHFQDGGQVLTDEGSVSPISPPGDSGFLDMEEVEEDMLTDGYAVLQLCPEQAPEEDQADNATKVNGFHKPNGLVESFVKREFMEFHQQGTEVTAFRMSGVQQTSIQENGLQQRNQTVQEKRSMRLTRERAVFDDDHHELHQPRRHQLVQCVESETVVRTSSRSDLTETTNKSAATSLESLLSDESNLYENLSFAGADPPVAELPPAVPQKRETPQPPPIPPRLPKLSPTAEPQLNSDDFIAHGQSNGVHVEHQTLSNGFHEESLSTSAAVPNNKAQAQTTLHGDFQTPETTSEVPNTDHPEETLKTHPLSAASRTSKTAVVRSLSLEEGRGMTRIRRSRSLSQGDDFVPGPRKSKSIGAYDGSRIPRPTFPVSSPRAGETVASSKKSKDNERIPTKNSRFGFESGGKSRSLRSAKNKNRKELNDGTESLATERIEAHPKPPRGPPTQVRSKSFEDAAKIPEFHPDNGHFPSPAAKSPVMQSRSLDSDTPKSSRSPPSRHHKYKSKSMEVLSQLAETDQQGESIHKKEPISRITSEAKPKTANSDWKKSPDSKPRSSDSRSRVHDSKSKVSDLHPMCSDSNARSPDSTTKSRDSKARTDTPKSTDSKSKTSDSKSADSKPKSPDSNSKSSNAKPRSPESRSKALDSKPKSADSQPKSSDSNSKSPDARSRGTESKSRSPDSKQRNSETRVKNLELKPKCPETPPLNFEPITEAPSPPHVEVKAPRCEPNPPETAQNLSMPNANCPKTEATIPAATPETPDRDNDHQILGSHELGVPLHLTGEAPATEGDEKQKAIQTVPDLNSGSWLAVEIPTAPESAAVDATSPNLLSVFHGEAKDDAVQDCQRNLLDQILFNGSDDDEVTQFRVEVATGGVLTSSSGFPSAEPFTDDKTFTWCLSRWPLQDVPEEEEPSEEGPEVPQDPQDEDNVFLDDVVLVATRDEPDGTMDSSQKADEKWCVDFVNDAFGNLAGALGIQSDKGKRQGATDYAITDSEIHMITTELEKRSVKKAADSVAVHESYESATIQEDLNRDRKNRIEDDPINAQPAPKSIHRASLSALDKLLGLSSHATSDCEKDPETSVDDLLEEPSPKTQQDPPLRIVSESTQLEHTKHKLEETCESSRTSPDAFVKEERQCDTEDPAKQPPTNNNSSSTAEGRSSENVAGHVVPIIAIEHVEVTPEVALDKPEDSDLGDRDQVKEDKVDQSQEEADTTDHPVVSGCTAVGDEDLALLLQQQESRRLPVVVDHVTKAEAAMHQGSLYRPPPEGHEFPPAYAEEAPPRNRGNDSFYAVPKTTRSASLAASNAANSLSVKDRIALFNRPDAPVAAPQTPILATPILVQRTATLQATPKTPLPATPSPLSRWHSAASLLTSERRPSYVSAYPETQLLRRSGYERSSSAATLLSSFLQDRRSSSSKLKGLVVPQGPAKVPAVPALPLIGTGASWRPAPLVPASFQLSHSKPVTPLTPEKPMPVSAVRAPLTPTSPPPPPLPTTSPPLIPQIAAVPIKPTRSGSETETSRPVFRNPIERLDSLLGARVPAVTIKASSPVIEATTSVSTNVLCTPSVATTPFVSTSPSGSVSGPPSLNDLSMSHPSLNGPSSLSPPPVPAQRTQSAPNPPDPSSTSRARFWSLRDDSDDDSNSVISLRTEDSRQTADDSLSDADSLHQERSDFRPRRLSQQRTVLSVAPSRQAQQSTDSVRQFRALAEKWESRAGVTGSPVAPVPPLPTAVVSVAPTFLFQPRSPRTPEPSKLPPSLQPRSIQDSKTALLERSLSTLDLVGSRLLQKTSRSVSVSDIRKSFETKKQVSEHRRFSSMDSTASDSGVGTPGGLYGSASSLHAASGTPSRAGGVGCSDSFGSATSLASDECCPVATSVDLQSLLDEAAAFLDAQGRHHQLTAVVLRKDIPTGSVGITLAGGADYEIRDITVHKVIASSLADRDGRLRKGDMIVSINGRLLAGLTHREALDLLKAHRQEVVLITSRATSPPAVTQTSAYDNRRKSSDLVQLSTNKTVTSAPRLTQQQPPVAKSMVQESTADSSSVLAQGTARLHLLKDGAGLGFSLEGGQGSPLGDKPLVVKRVFKGGAADRAGHLRVGDEVLKVGDQSVASMTRTEAWNFMKKLSDGPVVLTVRPLLQVPEGTLPN